MQRRRRSLNLKLQREVSLSRECGDFVAVVGRHETRGGEASEPVEIPSPTRRHDTAPLSRKLCAK